MIGRVRAAVSGFSQRWGFEAAVLRANQSFDHDHPDGCFDNRFLQDQAAPILARYLEGPTAPDPDELAGAWVQHLRGFPDAEDLLSELAISMATRYLLRLEEEMRSSRIGAGSAGFGRGLLSRS